MHRVLIGVVAFMLGVGMAFGIAACGGDDETTTATETQTETATAQQGKTQTATQTGATGTTTGTTTTKQKPADCGANQVFSQTSGTCVDIRQGNNPCPQGEVPMADRPVCVPKS